LFDKEEKLGGGGIFMGSLGGVDPGLAGIVF